MRASPGAVPETVGMTRSHYRTFFTGRQRPGLQPGEGLMGADQRRTPGLKPGAPTAAPYGNELWEGKSVHRTECGAALWYAVAWPGDDR